KKIDHFLCDHTFISNNTQKWYNIQVTPIGKNNDVVLVCTDITSQKITENRYKTCETSYRKLFEKMKEGLLCSDRNGIIKNVNPKFCELVEYTEQELIGTNGYELLLDKTTQSLLKEKIKNRITGKSENYDTEMVTK